MLKLHKVDFFSLLKTVGIILHVPAIMSFLSIFICLFWKEYFAIPSLLLFSIVIFSIGQLLYRRFVHKRLNNLWEAMVSASLGWILVSLVGAIPYYLISKKLISLGIHNGTIEIFTNFMNCIFESFSGFTSTGLTMLSTPSKLPHILQWWRSFQAWIGAMGLVIFIISIIEPKKEEYRLYFAEAKSEQVGKHIRYTMQKIWLIYLLYTFCLIFLFYLAKMPLWASINHAMTCIATGGFSISDNHFAAYSFSAQVIALFGMTLGCMSFSFHYRILREGKISYFWTSMQHRLLFIFLVAGSFIIILIDKISLENIPVFTGIFSWFTSLSTCGFRINDMTAFSTAGRLFFILAMIIGGASGSTSGGLKIRRIKNLFFAIVLRFKGITKEQEKEIIEEIEEEKEKKEVSEMELPVSEKTSILYSSTILFILWICTLVIGWFLLLLIVPSAPPINALFDIGSALGNVGLSTDIVHPSLSFLGKFLFIFIMLLGRLEIIPIIVLFSCLFICFRKR